MDKDKIERDWRDRGFSFGSWTDPVGQRWENYVHDTDELFMVLEGRIELDMKDKIFCPKVGQEVLIPAKVVHSVRNVGKTTARWLYGYKDE